MKLLCDYEISGKPVNWKISIFGLFFLCFRIICMSEFILEDGSFHPEVFHTSYLISLLICLSMVFSFRVKLLNVVPVAVLPSVIFSIFLHDIPIWIDPNASPLVADIGPRVIGSLFWWNFLTIHTPIPILAFYMIITRKETLSLHAYFMMLVIIITWFIALDDMDNGTIDGPTYIAIGVPLLIVWTFLYSFWIMKKIRPEDPLIAPVLEVKSIKIEK